MREATVGVIIELYGRRGDRRYGEGVSQLNHALQCAALAIADAADDAMIAAALLHDIGHLFEADEGEPALDARHEAVGARVLRGLFGPRVTRPIALHVAAKRYLCAADPGYCEGLSRASRTSLRLQGGPLSADRARRFERSPGFAAALRLRRYDDAGKVPDTNCAPLRAYEGLLRRLAAAHADADEDARSW